MKGDRDDPKALIREAYRIEGIGTEECRSVFMDWALSLPEGANLQAALAALLARYGSAAPDHPMTAILRDGQTGLTVTGRRRGGWRGRRQ
ncbi:hypothetical protein [Pseudooceanicola nanhaiensis]|uniref:hypothetical protein n=1 Tax=Pseudooceanicola nanhaiensis TaxID=375761 RepID=UPI001CD5A6E9|nr:hypothetical protein [Pseudooceanicola nanhaiensis]MCA0920949.1 hypothetical protein [Pseudooceanicola nanhaiensis]